MGDELQECSACKLVKHVNNFDGFKTCIWCHEHSRRYRERNKDEINRKRREKTTRNGAFNCRGCGLRVLPENTKPPQQEKLTNTRGSLDSEPEKQG